MPKLSQYHINGLPLPPLLIELIEQDKWVHPGKAMLDRVIPFFRSEVVFLQTIRGMVFESGLTQRDFKLWHDHYPHMFDFHSDFTQRENKLPWRDAKYSFFIATCASPGDDIAIALDYRLSMTKPRVIACNWHTDIQGCPWEIVSPDFPSFAKTIGLI